MAERTSLTDEQIQEYRDAFNLFDKDGDNTISTPELLTVMRSLGHNPSTTEVMGMIKEVDSNGNGKIEFNEFLVLMEKKLNSFESEELIREAFAVIDQNGDGYITLSQLRHVVHDLGLQFTDDELVDMIEEADPSGDGRVSYQGVSGLFSESQIVLSEEAQKRWTHIKKENGRKSVLGKNISPKAEVTRLPGKRIPKRDIKNKERFKKLNLVDKKKPVHKPGLTIRERRRLEQIGGVRAVNDNFHEVSVKKKQNIRNIDDNKPVNKAEQNVLVKTKENNINKGKYRPVINSEQYVSVKGKPDNTKTNENITPVDSDQDNIERTKQTTRENSDILDCNEDSRSLSIYSRYDTFNESEMSAGQSYYTEDGADSPQRLPPIEETDNPKSSRTNNSGNQESPNSSRRTTVHERLYNPDYRKNRGVPTEPEPVYVREFKARPPKNLEHVTSRHTDQSYYEPKGEYVLEEHEPWPPQFKARIPKKLEHVQSRHLSEEYFRKKEYVDNSKDDTPNTFVARPPQKLGHVQSRIMDQKYFVERSDNEDKQVKYDTEFKARLPKKLEHVQSRILDPKKPKPPPEEEEIHEASFKAKPPKQLEHVGSRILDPHFYEPRPEYVYEHDEEFNTEFKAKLPKSYQHVDTRIYDQRYFQKKIPPITTEDREVQQMNTEFKANLPKALRHVQSRAFDPNYNTRFSTPRLESPVVELKTKGSFVVINVKKDADGKPVKGSYSSRLAEEKMKDTHHYNQRQKDFNDTVNDIKGNTRGEKKHENNQISHGNTEVQTEEKPKRKPYKPPRKPKTEKVDKQFFDSWVMTPTHIYSDHEDLFYKNRQNVSEMWNSLAKTIRKTVIENGDRIQALDRTYY